MIANDDELISAEHAWAVDENMSSWGILLDLGYCTLYSTVGWVDFKEMKQNDGSSGVMGELTGSTFGYSLSAQ